MGHPNEQLLRDAYALFGKGDIEAFLGMCTGDIVFHVPGTHPLARDWDKAGFTGDFLQQFMNHTQGTFREDVLDVVANDDRGILLLHHSLEHGGRTFALRVAHVVEFRDGKISAWREWPGDMEKFEEAWKP